MPGLVLNGRELTVPGLHVVNYLDDPTLKLADRCYAKRRKDITFVVLHTTGGYPDEDHPTPQRVITLDSVAQCVPLTSHETPTPLNITRYCKARSVLADWAKPGNRIGGAHILVDADGTCYCVLDLLAYAAYHAVGVNQMSVGIEIVQQRDSSLFQAQLETLSKLLPPLVDELGLPRTVAPPYCGSASILLRNGAYLSGCEGVTVIGHRDASNNRGFGDPGDYVMDTAREALKPTQS